MERLFTSLSVDMQTVVIEKLGDSECASNYVATWPLTMQQVLFGLAYPRFTAIIHAYHFLTLRTVVLHP